MIPSLKTSQNDLLKSIEQYETKFHELKDRLDQVRVEKQKRYNQELESKSSKVIEKLLKLQKVLNDKLYYSDDLDDEFRHNDDMSVSEMSATTFDNQSSAGSTRSYASTVNSQFSGK